MFDNSHWFRIWMMYLHASICWYRLNIPNLVKWFFVCFFPRLRSLSSCQLVHCSTTFNISMTYQFSSGRATNEIKYQCKCMFRNVDWCFALFWICIGFHLKLNLIYSHCSMIHTESTLHPHINSFVMTKFVINGQKQKYDRKYIGVKRALWARKHPNTSVELLFSYFHSFLMVDSTKCWYYHHLINNMLN